MSQSDHAQRVKLFVGEVRQIAFPEAFTSAMVVDSELVKAVVKSERSMTLTGIKMGETLLIVSGGATRNTLVIEVLKSQPVQTDATNRIAARSEKASTLSGIYSISFSPAFDGAPALLHQTFDQQWKLGNNRTLSASGDLFKFFSGSNDRRTALARSFGVNRFSLGVTTPQGTLDLLDSDLNISRLSLNGYTMRGLHLTSNRESRLRGAEIFAGVARPSPFSFNADEGRLAGLVVPVGSGETWRVRAGAIAVLPRPNEIDGSGGGIVWQADGRYAPDGNTTAEGEVAYAKGGISWRGRLDLRRGALNFSGEALHLDGNSPFIRIGAYQGGRSMVLLSLQWRPSKSFAATVSYNRSTLSPLPSTRRPEIKSESFATSASYRFSPNSRLGFRYAESKVESGASVAARLFETRSASISYSASFGNQWTNLLEARFTSSRESRAGAKIDRGLVLRAELRRKWQNWTATAFINYTRNTPSLESLIVRNPTLLPPLLRRAFEEDPARFLETNGASITGRSRRELYTTFGAGLRLDAANSLQVAGSRTFASGATGGRTALTFSYTHRFGGGGRNRGFQLTELFGLGRGRIVGRAFFDLNGNGVEDTGEGGVPNIRVQLDGDRSATTDAQGRFRFDADAGDYNVAIISDQLGATLRGSNQTEQRISLSPRQTVSVNFGLTNFGSIAGRIFNDLLLTGEQKAGNAPGIGGVRLSLRPAGAPNYGTSILTQTVDANGIYRFSGLTPGNYTLEIDPMTLPANYNPPAQTTWQIKIEPLQNVSQDVALAAQRAVSGIVFIDKDSDGRFDPQRDEAVVGARVTAGRVEALSDDGGSYLLRNLTAGIIKIHVRSPWGVESRPVKLELGTGPTARRNINLTVTR